MGLVVLNGKQTVHLLESVTWCVLRDGKLARPHQELRVGFLAMFVDCTVLLDLARCRLDQARIRGVFFCFAWRFGWQTNGLRKSIIFVHVKLLIHQFEEVQEQIMACVRLAGRIMIFRRPESQQ